MNYFIYIHSNKAKNDINQIVLKAGYQPIGLFKEKNTALFHFASKCCAMWQMLWRLKKGDVLLIQYPLKKFYSLACRIARMRGAKVITLIHDLGTFRRHKLKSHEEVAMLNHSHVLIVHNAKMDAWLKRNDLNTQTVQLGIFDYLIGSVPDRVVRPYAAPYQLVFAGGFGKWRSKFLEGLDGYLTDCRLNLFGKGATADFAKDWKNIDYHGCFAPEELVKQVQAHYGLVWDGDSMDECSGDWGEYLKINNPHKTSFALRCHFPVIIWRQAAMAAFVEEHKCGILVDSLRDISDAVKAVTPEQYAEMQRNAAEIGEKLEQGFFTLAALEKAQEMINN